MDGNNQISYKLLCNACLCLGQGLNLITDSKLKRFYLEALNEIPLHNIANITPVLCCDCEALLRRAMIFREQVKESYQVLLSYTSENLNKCCLPDMSRTPRLRVKTNDIITILPDNVEYHNDVENDDSSLTVKNEDLTDWKFNRVIPDMPESLQGPDSTQRIYLKDDLKVEYDKDSVDSDNNADPGYQPDVLAELNTLVGKKNKKTKKRLKEKTIKKVKEKNFPSHSRARVVADGAHEEGPRKRSTKRQQTKKEHKILTVELSYEDMMLERDKDLAKDTYLNSEYKCESCIVGFNYYKSFKTHLTVKHSESIGDYSCPVCKTVHSTIDSFTAHYKRHMRRYECSICQKRAMDLKVMQQHYYSTHEISLKKYKCDDCGKVSNSIDTHRYHRESHKARLQCSECDKTFRHRAGLLNHRLAVHEYKNKFPCNVCNKIFKWRTSLRRHQETHETKKPVAAAAYCALCGVSFSSLCSYQRHMNNSLKHITKDQLRFICDHCNIKFADKTKLRDHIEEKHLHKTFQCHICLKTSKNRVGLDQHIRNVHKGRPNNKMCHHCGKGFPTKVQLESHIRTHTGERPFICEYCPTTFSQQSNLYKHNRQVHLNVKSKRYPTVKKSDNGPPPEPNPTMNQVSQAQVSVVLHYSAEPEYLTAEM